MPASQPSGPGPRRAGLDAGAAALAAQAIDDDHITQAVIASHAGAADARLRDVMTSLVQHLHAFARDVKLTESEWRAGLRFLGAAGRTAGAASGVDADPEAELAALSDLLGLSVLVAALGRPRGAGSNGARPALQATLLPSPAAPPGGPVHALLCALGRGAWSAPARPPTPHAPSKP